ncbi:diacylglycerol/lipid kinase family protein [Parasediminibacterium sp. JCM 36343]|uniref:diacylglycerol/lipid kinase family protein n=1 Tax=Parasediminibacterium sp. JCM 36343 TaxID=3374279 RepID=UPI00397E3698
MPVGKIIYLINPISGTSKKEGVRQLINDITLAHKVPFEIIDTNASGNYDFLKDKIETEQITDLAIVGGDGTVNQVISALYKTVDINFGIVPTGSGNGLALAAGIPKKPKDAINHLFTGNPKYIDAFTINNKFSCMLSGVGFDAQVAHDFALGNSRGLLAYTQQSLINFFKAQPYQFEITVDGFTFFTESYFISIANGNQFGNNVTIAPEANLGDGLLDVVIVQKMSKAKLPFAVLRQIRGNNKLQSLVNEISTKNVLYFQTPSLSIQNLKLAPLHIDGEPAATASQLQVDILKDCFKLIQ